MSEWELKKNEHKEKLQPRTVIYGEPKIGKSTFGSEAPNPVFIPTEDGISALNVMQLPSDRICATWDDVLKAVATLIKIEHDRKWVIIDTISGVWDLCAQHVCERDFGGVWEARKGSEGFNSFAKGEKATAMEFKRILAGLDKLRNERGMGCILLAHEQIHKVRNDYGEDFYTTGAHMGTRSWHVLKSWADHIGYACRDFVVQENPRQGQKGAKAIAKNNKRWLVFDGGPGRDAGGRAGYDMPDRTELIWSQYADHLYKNFGEQKGKTGRAK